VCGVLGRRLPNADELGSFGEEPGVELDDGEEWASDRNATNAVTVDDGFSYQARTDNTLHAFRCEAPLSN
jgi:hypothetical protein